MILERFEKWFSSFLVLRGLDVYSGGDGRALYQYQMTDSEVRSLKKLFSLYYDGTSLNRELQKFYGASYCLLVSEFYRREYERSWGWSEPNKFTGIKIDLLDKGREDLIESGIRYWKLIVPRDTPGYHGWLLRQGGLPWRLCQKDDDIIFLTIKKLLANYNIEKQRFGTLLPFIKEEVEAAKATWPNFQKNQETYQIIEDIVETLISLRTEFSQLDNTDDPYTFLDNHKDKWREGFPIPLDEKNAMGIVNEWFKVAGKQVKEKVRISAENNAHLPLRLSSKVTWNNQFDLNIVENLKTEILFPKTVVLKGDGHRHLRSGRYELMFYEDDTLIAKSGVLLGRVIDAGHSIKIEFPSAKEAYAIKRHNLDKPAKMGLMNNGVIVAEYLLDDSVVNIAQPLAFVRRENQYILVSDSSASVKEERIQVRIPTLNYELSTIENGYTVLSQQAHISWVQITSNTTLFFPESGDKFYYAVAVLEGFDKPFLDGELLQDIMSSRSCYLGFPELKNIEGEYQEYVNGRVISESDKLSFSGNINYQVKNSGGQTLLTRRFAVINRQIMLDTGPLYIGKGKAEFQFRVRVPKLVSKADSFLSYDRVLDCYLPEQPQGAKLLSKDQVDHGAYLERIYSFEISNLEEMNYRLKVKVESSDHHEALELRLPLHPHEMIILENDNPVEMNTDLILMIDDLLRYELRVAGKKGDEVELIYELRSKKVRQKLKTTRTIPLVKNYLSINLYGIKDEISNILSVVDDIDAYIKVKVVHSNIGEMNFYVKHHNSYANFYVDSLLSPFPACLHLQNIKLEKVMGMEWLFVPLMSPDKLYPLTIDDTQVVAEGVFISFKEKIENETLGLIMTSDNSLHSIRPVFISNEELLDIACKELSPATMEGAIAMYQPREHHVFSPIMTEMLENNQSQNWHYYKVFPHTYLSHYPLSVFEPWKALSRDLRLLASATIKFGWDEFFCQRIQDELGVLFEAIPIKYWKEPVGSIFSMACESGMNLQEVFPMLEERLLPVSDICLSKDILMRYVFGRGTQDAWREEDPRRLLYLQELRTRLRERSVQWPSTLAEELKNWYRENYYHFPNDSKFTDLLIADKRNMDEYAVLLLPIYMAGIALNICHFKDVLDDKYFSYNRLRVQFYELKFVIEEIKAFDREWYEACYQYVLSYGSRRIL